MSYFEVLALVKKRLDELSMKGGMSLEGKRSVDLTQGVDVAPQM